MRKLFKRKNPPVLIEWHSDPQNSDIRVVQIKLDRAAITSDELAMCDMIIRQTMEDLQLLFTEKEEG